MPGPSAERRKATSLWRKVSIPMASAAISSSRMVMSRSPKRDVMIR
jgi:hypothetical protein